MRSLRLPSNFALAVLLLSASVPAFAQNDAKYDEATKAANSGDPAKARDLFCAIDPAFKDSGVQCGIWKTEAQNQINRWNKSFLDGQDLLQKGKYEEAKFKFQNVKGGQYQALAKQQLDSIPGLIEKAKRDAQATQQQAAAAQADTDAQNKLNSANSAYNSGDYPTAKNLAGQLSGTKFSADAQSLLNKISQAESAKSAAASRPSAPAPKPQVDTPRLLAEAAAAMKKKDYKTAQSLFSRVRTADPKNSEAQQGLDAIAATGYEAGADEADEDLAGALSDFYKGNLDDAETSLRNYRSTNGTKKPGLGRFYYAATMLTKYYLNGADDAGLLQRAKDMFKEASKVKGFNPPEKYVSPKIMKVYKDATGG